MGNVFSSTKKEKKQKNGGFESELDRVDAIFKQVMFSFNFGRVHATLQVTLSVDR